MSFLDFCERVAESHLDSLPGPWVLTVHRRQRWEPGPDLATFDLFPSYRYARRQLYDRGLRNDMNSGYYVLAQANWIHRETVRLETGEYTKPVWKDERWWRNRSRELIEHFAHVSTEAPGMIAFTESPEKGELDRQTRTKAGRYLKKYFSNVLTDKEIAFFAEWQTRGQRPKTDLGKLTLKFATTPDEIVAVYSKGPASCMQGSDSVRVYGAGDLAIAYLESADYAGQGPKIIARVLTWPEKKAMGRIYPNTHDWQSDGFNSSEDSQSAFDTLHDMLKADGYTSFYENGKIFDGAKMLAIKSGYSYVMPYIDKLMTSFGQIDGKDTFWLSENGDYSADMTDGTLGDDVTERATCDACGEAYNEDDGCCAIGDTGTMLDICPRCNDAATWYCDFDGETYMDSVESVSVGGSGELWTAQQFSDHGFTCAHDGCAWSRDDESERFPGYHEQYDDDSDAHPELSEEAAPEDAAEPVAA